MSERKLYRSLSPYLNLYLDDMSIIARAMIGDVIITLPNPDPSKAFVPCMSKIGYVYVYLPLFSTRRFSDDEKYLEELE